MSVYYIHAPAVGCVKIGFSTNVRARFGKIQADSPVDLVLLATEDGGVEIESLRHRQFARHHVRGEWYRYADDLIAHIKSFAPYIPQKRVSLNKKLVGAGLSQSYASQIIGGKRKPPRSLAIHILRTTGWRHAVLDGLTDEQIELLEQIEPYQPKQAA